MDDEQVVCPICGSKDILVGQDVMSSRWYLKCNYCGAFCEPNTKVIKEEFIFDDDEKEN